MTTNRRLSLIIVPTVHDASAGLRLASSHQHVYYHLLTPSSLYFWHVDRRSGARTNLERDAKRIQHAAVLS